MTLEATRATVLGQGQQPQQPRRGGVLGHRSLRQMGELRIPHLREADPKRPQRHGQKNGGGTRRVGKEGR